MSEIPESLHKLLLALKSADEAIENIDLSAQIDLMDAAKHKIDSIKYVIDKLEAQAFYLAAREQEYCKAKESVLGNIESLKRHLLFALQSNHFPKFTGYQYVALQAKAPPSVKTKIAKPSLSHAVHFGDYVKTEYKWDKTAIRNALKLGEDPSVKEIAEFEQKTYVKFSVNKEATQ